MKRILLFLLVIGVLFSCSNDNDELINQSFSDLNFGLNKSQKVKLNLNDKKKVSKFSSDLIDELDALINDNKKLLIQLELRVSKESNLVIIERIKKIDRSKLKRKSDPIEELMGSCPDGWTNEGNCSSANCVKQKVASVLSKIESKGDCWRVQVSRGVFSAKVCSQEC